MPAVVRATAGVEVLRREREPAGQAQAGRYDMADRDESLNGDEDDLEDGEEVGETTETGGRSGTLSFMAGMVLGALVGAGVALLMAPERGAITRRRLKKLMGRMRNDAKEKVEDWRDDVKAELKRRRRQIREQIER
jgi:hypothetical protein